MEAVPALVAVLGGHRNVAAVAEGACGALNNIAATSAGKAACIAAVPAIVAALQAHASVAAVARQAYVALWSIACSPSGKQAVFAHAPALVSAYSVQWGPETQWVAYCALGTLGFHVDGSKYS